MPLFPRVSAGRWSVFVDEAEQNEHTVWILARRILNRIWGEDRWQSWAPLGLPQLGVLAQLEREPWRAFGLWVCWRGCNRGFRHLPSPPLGQRAIKVSLVSPSWSHCGTLSWFLSNGMNTDTFTFLLWLRESSNYSLVYFLTTNILFHITVNTINWLYFIAT